MMTKHMKNYGTLEGLMLFWFKIDTVTIGVRIVLIGLHAGFNSVVNES